MIKWGVYTLPEEHASGHFLFLGATGSGKTVLIKMLMNSVLSASYAKPGTRALVYDAKQDSYSLLADLGLENRVRLLNPFDRRGVAWNIAEDVSSAIVARQVATILIPESERSTGADQFFTEASREIVTAVLMGLSTQHPGKWTLRDLLLITLYPENLKNYLSQSQLLMSQRVTRMYLEAEERTFSNILSTMSSKLGIYEPIAAAWDKRRSNGSFSVKSWINSDLVMVLGNDESARTSLDAINRCLFQRVTENLLNRTEVHQSGDRTWLILDEVREAGKLEGLRRLLNKGRSKGACVVLGCQDVEGMRAVYGREEGNEILSQCGHVVVLNLVSPDTADWAARLFGQEYKRITGTSVTQGSQYSEGESTKEELRSVVTTLELLSMRRIHPMNGISGYYRSSALQESAKIKDWPIRQRIAPWLRATDSATYSWEAAVGKYLPKERLIAGKRPFDFEECDPAEQILTRWTPEEERRFIGMAVPGAPKPSGDKPASKGPVLLGL